MARYLGLDQRGPKRMSFGQALRSSLRNIAKYGDTDIFPQPFENHIFFDEPEKSLGILEEIHNKFDFYLAAYPPLTIDTLAQVGYTGFRWATQIEPFWNAYYLALVLALADKIEAKRIPSSTRAVFSYRYSWN
jgi:hypothetical protein